MNRLAALLSILFLSAPGAVWAQRIVATVDGKSVETSVFEQRYKEYLARTGTQDATRLRNAVLGQIINDRLIIADGRRRGLDGDADYETFEASARRKLLVESYLARAVADAVAVTDEDVEEAFVRINTEIEARHLFARTRAEADRLHARVTGGESFEEIAREIFIDPVMAENGGSVGRFTFDELDPDFEDAAFGLGVGEISEPVRTVYGYSIIQVVDRFTKPILTELEFAQKKETLRAFVLQKKRVQARSHFVRAQAEKLSPTFHGAFERLFGQVTGLVLIADEEMDEFVHEPLVSFNHGGARATWTVAEFRDQAALTSAEQRAQVRTETDLQDFVTALVVRASIVEAATHLELGETPEFERALTQAADEFVLKRQRERLVDEIAVPEDSIRAHYERFPAEFTDGEGLALPYEETRPLILEQLRFAYGRKAIEEFVASLRRDADVEIDRTEMLGVRVPNRPSATARGPSVQPLDERAENVY